MTPYHTTTHQLRIWRATAVLRPQAEETSVVRSERSRLGTPGLGLLSKLPLVVEQAGFATGRQNAVGHGRG